MRYEITNQWADETPGLTELPMFQEAVVEVKRLLSNIPCIHIPGLARRYPQWQHIIIDVVHYIEAEGLAETELQGEITAVRPCDRTEEMKAKKWLYADMNTSNLFRDMDGQTVGKKAAAGMLKVRGHHEKAKALLEEV